MSAITWLETTSECLVSFPQFWTKKEYKYFILFCKYVKILNVNNKYKQEEEKTGYLATVFRWTCYEGCSWDLFLIFVCWRL